MHSQFILSSQHQLIKNEILCKQQQQKQHQHQIKLNQFQMKLVATPTTNLFILLKQWIIMISFDHFNK